MGEQSAIEKLVQQYEKNPVIKGLIQLIPFGIGSAIDSSLLTHVQNIREERTKTFFDELSTGNIELKPELLESEDFLHCYFATTKAALNSRRREKIKMFARLLKASTLPDSFANIDEYEDYLKILDELSYRELLILSILEKYESAASGGNEYEKLLGYWEQFKNELETELKIIKDEINPILTRLIRTGCFESFSGKYMDYEPVQGALTPAYFRLKHLIKNDEGKFA